MFYRIDRENKDNGTVSYEYVLGRKNLGKSCFRILSQEQMTITHIWKLVWSLKAFRICFFHTISEKKNLTSEN